MFREVQHAADLRTGEVVGRVLTAHKRICKHLSEAEMLEWARRHYFKPHQIIELWRAIDCLAAGDYLTADEADRIIAPTH